MVAVAKLLQRVKMGLLHFQVASQVRLREGHPPFRVVLDIE